MNKPLFIDGMLGLGDSIFQRAFIKKLPPGTYVRTSWPELYEDLPVFPVRSGTTLRTQRKNEENTRRHFHDMPEERLTRRIFYGNAELKRGSIFDAMRTQFGVEPHDMSLPSFGAKEFSPGRPYAVIRPATVRKEWRSDSRNPDPEYLIQATSILRKHFYLISVADLIPDEEWPVGNLPPADLRLHSGQLDVTGLMRLIEHAAVVVTPVGWALPAAIAYQTPVYVIAGGRGAHNAPEIITDPSMDLSRVGWAIPDNYCRCADWDHQCDKHISNFGTKFEAWLNEVVSTDID